MTSPKCRCDSCRFGWLGLIPPVIAMIALAGYTALLWKLGVIEPFWQG